MNNVPVSIFLNYEVSNYAAYDNIRKISSYIDGLKLSTRKILYYMLENNIKKEEKVSRLTSKIAEFTEYLHGEASLEGVLKNMAQNFIGSNNLPLLKPEGNFGTRFIPEPGASRYIYTKLQSYTRYIFKKEDDPILTKQYFEGHQVEYKHYLPIIPYIFLNGQSGLSTGFAQKLLSRKIETLIKAVRKKLEGYNITNEDLSPGFENYKGTIEKIDNGKYEILGVIKKTGRLEFTITEIPPFYSLKKYICILDNLEAKKIIKSSKDFSENDNFKFVVKVDNKFLEKYKTDSEILNVFKLKYKFSENYTIINEDNKAEILNSPIEIFDKYFEERYKGYEKRKKYILNNIQKESEFLTDRKKFIEYIITDKIIINKKTKDEIIEQCKENKIKFYDDHLKMNLLSLSKEKIDELENEIYKLQNEYNDLKNKSVKDLWSNDLNDLETFLK